MNRSLSGVMVYCKNDLTRKMIDFNTFPKLPKNVGDLGKLVVAKGFKKLPKVHEIAQSGYTGRIQHRKNSN